MIWNARLAVPLGIALAAFVAGWSVNGWRLGMSHAEELKRMYQAGVKAYESRDERAREELMAYADEIRSRAAPVRRVYLCPDVPEAAGGAADPPGREHPQTGRDITAALVDARNALLRCRALVRYLNEP